VSALGLPYFSSMEAFYAERGGARSGESDFGCWWYDGEQAWSGCWRVSAVADTGDVYAVKDRVGGRDPDEAPAGVVLLLGNLGGPDPVYERAYAVLAGWEEIVGKAESLSWALARVKLAAGQLATVPEIGSERPAGRPATLGELAAAATLLLVALQPWALHGADVQRRASELTLVLARLPMETDPLVASVREPG